MIDHFVIHHNGVIVISAAIPITAFDPLRKFGPGLSIRGISEATFDKLNSAANRAAHWTSLPIFLFESLAGCARMKRREPYRRARGCSTAKGASLQKGRREALPGNRDFYAQPGNLVASDDDAIVHETGRHATSPLIIENGCISSRTVFGCRRLIEVGLVSDAGEIVCDVGTSTPLVNGGDKMCQMGAR